MKKLRKRSGAWMLLWIALTVVACFVLAIAICYAIMMITLAGSIIRGNSDFWGSEPFGKMIGGIGSAVIVVVAIISKYFWGKFNTQCDACKKLGALKFANTKALREESISILVDMKQKNRKGDVIGTQEQYMPGKRIEYRDTYRCKYCGATESYARTVDKANV